MSRRLERPGLIYLRDSRCVSLDDVTFDLNPNPVPVIKPGQTKFAAFEPNQKGESNRFFDEGIDRPSTEKESGGADCSYDITTAS